MILLLDNYDSFTWNLFHYLEHLSSEKIEVCRNDEITIDDAGQFSSVVLSPGPGLPSDAGIMPALIKQYYMQIPILGICLGHQAIGETLGGRLLNPEKVWHGVQRVIEVDNNDRLFTGLPKKINSGHYHSWVIDGTSLPEEIKVTATALDGTVMAISHSHYPLSGVQFHPESILTENGMAIMKNWLNYCNRFRPQKDTSANSISSH